MARPVRFLLALTLAVPLAAGCASGGDVAPPPPPPPPSLSDGPLNGPVVVFASVPLKGLFEEMQGKLTQSNPTLSIVHTFAATPQLVGELERQVPADVIASADQESLRKLQTANLIETPAVFARNKLQIAVAKDNPKKITSLADLARPGLKVALVDAGQPLGRDAKKALDNKLVVVKPSAAPPDAKAALDTVTAGQADATLVYVTDVAEAGGTVTGVAIPDNDNVVASYRIAVIKGARNAEGAKAYADYLVNGAGQRLIRGHGFFAP
jgi:molybdate transport system substrate-binding protein